MAVAIDWVARWRELVEGREAQAERVRAKQGVGTTGAYWDQRAAGFREGVAERSGETEEVLEVMTPVLSAESTVLDVGAGVGRYGIPLARVVKQVTAVEPSTGMLKFLKEDAAAAGVKNLEVHQANWDEATVDPVDVVLCSHVVYFIRDIGRFVQKVAAHARGHVFVAVRTSPRDGVVKGLWQEVHGESRIPEPGLVDLYPVLHQVLGVCANVHVATYGGGRNALGVFQRREDAMPEVRRQALIAEGSPEETAALAYLEKHMVEGEGGWVLPGPAVSNAVVWWDNRAGSKHFVR